MLKATEEQLSRYAIKEEHFFGGMGVEVGGGGVFYIFCLQLLL